MTDVTDKTTLQNVRLCAMWFLLVVLFATPGIFFFRWVFRDPTTDVSQLNDYFAAGFFFVVGIAVPAVSFIGANTRISSYKGAAKQNVDKRLAWFSLATLIAACAYILIATVLFAFFLHKDVKDFIEGHGELARTIRYPIDEAMRIICSVFGGLMTFALSLEVLSLPTSKR